MVTRKCSGQRTGWTGKPLNGAADRRSARSNGATVCEPCGFIPLLEPFCDPQTSPAGPPPGRRVRPVREPRARTAVRRSRDHPPLRFAFFAQFRLAAGIKRSVAESHIVRPVFPLVSSPRYHRSPAPVRAPPSQAGLSSCAVPLAGRSRARLSGCRSDSNLAAQPSDHDHSERLWDRPA